MDLVRNQQGGFCRKTPIIALTANAMSGAEEKYRKMGFSDYLAKPINGILFEAMLLRYLPKERIEYMIDPDEVSEMDGFRILGQKKKQRLIVSTDNVVDLPNDVIRQLGIPVMHYFVNTEYGHYEDMVEIHSDSLLSYIEKDQYAKSEAPTVGEYETFLEICLRRRNRYCISVLLQNPERDLRMQARRQPDFPMCRCLIPVICRAVQV